MLTLAIAAAAAGGVQGFYREPDQRGQELVFVAEGDLHVVDAAGGVARRLTRHIGQEHSPRISRSGARVAYVGERDGVADLYVVPMGGGPPDRLTFGAEVEAVVGWSPDGRVAVRSSRYNGLPGVGVQLVNTETREVERLPFDQAADAAWMNDVVFFTRPGRQRSETRAYQGGTAQDIWRRAPGEEAHRWASSPRTEKSPMPVGGRVFFLSDRGPKTEGWGGTMNLWSALPSGEDLRRETSYRELGIREASSDGASIVFRRGADLYRMEPGRAPVLIETALATDLDQLRTKTITEPWEHMASAHLSADGKAVAIVVRGRGYVLPTGIGRRVRVRDEGAGRLRELQFRPGKDELVAFGDGSGEMNLYLLSRWGLEAPRKLTDLGPGFRSGLRVSPDGRRAAFVDRALNLWVTELDTGATRRLDKAAHGRFSDLSWSVDGEWLTYVGSERNRNGTIRLTKVDGTRRHVASTWRRDAFDPVFHPDGAHLYFLADLRLSSTVRSPWGTLQPEPHFDDRTLIQLLPLSGPERSPFAPRTELDSPSEKDAAADKAKEAPRTTPIDPGAMEDRLHVVPAPAGNHGSLEAAQEHLFWLDGASRFGRERALWTLPIRERDRSGPEPKKLMDDVESFSLSQRGDHLLVRKERALYVIPANGETPADMEQHAVSLGGFELRIDPREEWRQMFLEAWRLERDYFYDPGLHGVDWEAVKARYLPLAERVTDRIELNDVIAQMVAELSALHIFVRGGDTPEEAHALEPGRLGVRLVPVDGGARIEHVFVAPSEHLGPRSPLSEPHLGVRQGDIIASVDGRPVTRDETVDALLLGRAHERVRLGMRRGERAFDVIVEPITPKEEADLRYTEWELSRRLRVERESDGRVGYVHLRAMGQANIGQWAEQFYAVFDRPGLVIDVRNNRGGNIDSWILEKLLRRAWFWWKPRAGSVSSNMQYAFRGHVVVLVNEWTASDGEAFAEGFRRLGLGKIYGVRTWGGEIWLNFDTGLADGGIATAAQFGVYGPEGAWLIEGHGVEPDVVVENFPVATFEGEDAQLERALNDLKAAIEADPRPTPPAPAYPTPARR